jgi:hypothetical protein
LSISALICGMAKKKRDSVSIDDLDPFELDASPENIALVEKGMMELNKRKLKLDQKRLVWGTLVSDWKKQLGILPPEVSAEASRLVVRHPRGIPRRHQGPFQAGGDLNLIEGSMADAVYKILSDAARPITFQELEEELRKTELGSKITKFERPHYGAVQRLRVKGFIKDHNGRIATPGTLKKFLDDVAAGHAEDVFVPRMRNKWAEEIVSFLETRPDGATTREIIDYMKSIPEYQESTGNYQGSYVYNVISRLKDRQKLIEKCGKLRYRLCKFGNGAAHVAEPEKVRVTEGKPSVTH